MRLIDADKIDFGKIFIGASDFAKDTREAAQRLIDEMPTAYDVNKVMQRIDNEVSGLTNLQIYKIDEIVMAGMKEKQANKEA